jgi:hypothetical protein
VVQVRDERMANEAENSKDEQVASDALAPAAASWIAWLLVVLADAVVLAVASPRGISPGTRAIMHAYHAGNLLALGLVASAVVGAWVRWAPRARRPRLVAFLCLLALALAVGYPVLDEDLVAPAARLALKVPGAVWPLLASLVWPGAALVGALLARPRLRWIGVVGGLGLATANAALFPTSYRGLHLYATLTASTLVASALAGARRPARAASVPARGWAAPTLGLALTAAWSVTVWPRNAAVLALFRQENAVLLPYLARFHEGPQGPTRVPEAQGAWFTSRATLPAIPPSAPPLLDQDAIVLLLGIDSMRAEVLADEKYRATLPELFRLKDESTYFANARSAGPSTAPSLASLFSGTYFSQMFWVMHPRHGYVFPHLDTSERFPQLLRNGGVVTATVDATAWLSNDYGIARGFGSHKRVHRRGSYFAPGSLLLAAAQQRLEAYDTGRLFFFAHFLDAHTPYTSAGKKRTPFEGYVAELGLVDGLLGKLRKTLAEQGLLDRATIIVMADHGEAFGEHGMTWHAMTLYDELLRVPLMIRVPGVAPRTVTDPVSLVDLAPTILDLFGVPTPGRFMGESLTGYLRGEPPQLHRPIVAEGRLKRSMVLPDGFKVIHDTRSHGIEIYDLRTDPGEEHNLYDEGSAESAERLGVLDTFFRAQTLKRPGYQVPFRKW